MALSEQVGKLQREDLEDLVIAQKNAQDELKKQNDILESRVNSLTEAVNQLEKIVVGGLPPKDYDDSCIRARLSTLESKDEERDEQLEMFTLTDGGRKKPDERAQYLRQVLYNKAKKSANGMASMDKDSANAALGGELARATVMDALRRAADGEDADIDGSSKLENIPAIQFKKFDDPDKLSRVQIDLSDLTDREARKNLTTGETDKGV